jgi:hypothetical protein
VSPFSSLIAEDAVKSGISRGDLHVAKPDFVIKMEPHVALPAWLFIQIMAYPVPAVIGVISLLGDYFHLD